MRIANYLTMFRIAMVPVFMTLFSYKRTLSALIVFSVASLTDYFDGLIARREGTTSFGKFMDPLADKLLVGAALIVFTRADDGLIPGWMVLSIIGREFVVTGLRLVMVAGHGDVVSATKLGKYKASSQMIVIVISLLLLTLHDYRERFAVRWALIEKMRDVHGPIYFMMFLPLLLTLISGLEFLYHNRKTIWELMMSVQPLSDGDEDS
ncbi:TPA: CDP-diacylglycerol--glycerol-3-phosphate 3-phosphatidyltransferase [Candidatus Poribacteria bacterium]|nr:CDP-diacylglycerol--glycerol-3-phosphate 3-phosphatidyltransferase [Candidatus Poribacteria bacterium]